MARVDELQKEYPGIPREVILKLDVLRLGMKDTDDLDKVSTWAPALGSYQSYDYDISLEQMAKERPHRFKPGFILRPDVFFMRNGMSTRICRSSKSNYEIKDIGGGRFALYEREEKLEDVFFYRPKPRTGPAPLTSKGTPVSTLVGGSDCSFTVAPVRFCEYFGTGEQCKFCNYNSTYEDARSVGVGSPVTISLEETVEAYKIRSSETRLVEGCFMMGGFRSSEREGKIFFDFVSRMAKAAPYKPNFTCITQEMTRRDMLRLEDAGLNTIAIQLEMWGRELFEEICPGKASHAPYDRWLECMQEAVDIFGFGCVGSKIISGLSLLAPNGPKTWQEARDSHIEGLRWMVKNGVFPNTTVMRLGKGSIYGENESNWAKLPPTEYHLDVAKAHHEACEEVGMYEKMNKMIYNIFRAGHIGYRGEIGMLARCADMGKWASTCVPDEVNWLARFIASIQSPAKAQ